MALNHPRHPPTSELFLLIAAADRSTDSPTQSPLKSGEQRLLCVYERGLRDSLHARRDPAARGEDVLAFVQRVFECAAFYLRPLDCSVSGPQVASVIVPVMTETWELPAERLTSVPLPVAPAKIPVPPAIVNIFATV